jgi:DNA invertase Pin-like site-specific DNA recombinase
LTNLGDWSNLKTRKLFLDGYLISQRTKEALAAKKKAGIKLGRSKGSGTSKLDKHRPVIEALLANGSTQRYIAIRFNTTEANLSRWMTKHGLKRKKHLDTV